MVIDTSAIVAILFDEDDGARYMEAIERNPGRLISAVTRVELCFVIESRKREPGRVLLDRFLALIGAEIVSVTPQQAMLAIGAFRKFGRGRHPAALNIGDSFAYALASASADTLLFKGRGFAQTDIRPALAP